MSQKRTLSKLFDRQAGFVLRGDFNEDNQQDVALFGRYQEENATIGAFLLIATQTNGKWKRSQIFTFKEEFVIGIMYADDEKRLEAYFCVGCDHGGRISWNGKEYYYDPFPPPGVR